MKDLLTIRIDPAKIRAAREKAGFKQDKAGSLVGVSNKQISNIEVGRKKPSADVLARLCVLYRVDISDVTNAQAA